MIELFKGFKKIKQNKRNFVIINLNIVAFLFSCTQFAKRASSNNEIWPCNVTENSDTIRQPAKNRTLIPKLKTIFYPVTHPQNLRIELLNWLKMVLLLCSL